MKEYISLINSYNIPKLKTYLQTLSISTLKEIKEYLDDLYYNDPQGSPISDEKYDILFNIILNKEPLQKEKIGAKLREGENRVALPYWLGSMDKFKPADNEKINRWLTKFPSKDGYTISEKLDGVSCLLIKDDSGIFLYTRGDGKIGADISYLANYIKGIPKNLKEDLVARGELIISKSDWKKYTSEFKNPRQMVSGLVNAKTARAGLKDIQFVAYEKISDQMLTKPINQVPILKQLESLESLGFKTALYTVLPSIDIEKLMEILTNFKAESKFEIDGIIIQANIKYIRNTTGNPEYAFAFKMTIDENILPTKVIGVEWNLSKRGVLKPRIQVEPVDIGGVTIQFATGFNAKFISDFGIGPGAIVNITRSGDVIPYIVSVQKGVEPQFPEEEWEWKESRVDIVPIEVDIQQFCLKIFKDFFSTFGIQFVSESTISKLQEAGMDSILKILQASKKDFQKIPGLGERSGERIYDNIHKGLKNITLSQLMTSSSLFGGIAGKKFDVLLEDIPDILSYEGKELYEKILNVRGFSDISAQKVIDNLESFILFLNEINPYISFKKEEKKKKTGDLEIKVVFSGFRSKELEELVKSKGGEVTSAVSRKTTHLVVKDKGESSTKISKAIEFGIPILDEEEFKEYLNN